MAGIIGSTYDDTVQKQLAQAVLTSALAARCLNRWTADTACFLGIVIFAEESLLHT